MSQVQRSSVDESNVFKDYIQRNTNICSNCFRRMFEEYDRNYFVDNYAGDTWIRPIRNSIDQIVSDQKFGVDVEYAHADTTTGGEVLICECGVFSSQRTERPVGKGTLMEMAHRLVDRLDEADVEFNEDTLYDNVRERAEDPDWQGRQDEIFEVACNAATEP